MLDSIQTDVDITHLSNFNTRALTSYYFEINSMGDIEKLPEIFKYIQQNNINYLFVGSGTNLLFGFDHFKGMIIKNNLKGWGYNKNTCILDAYSSEEISSIAEILEKNHNQTLWHRFIGLPGSVGAAIFGNAGCFGLEVENNFVEALVYNIHDQSTVTLNKKNMKFAYRSSILKQTGKYFLIKAQFNLSKKIEKYHSEVDNLDFRENKQPKGNTCGSFFKNPSKEFSAGKLIEETGLKGCRIGSAYFSEMHSNFLMSDKNGNYEDLLLLIEVAQKKVKKQFNIDLEPEVRIITNL